MTTDRITQSDEPDPPEKQASDRLRTGPPPDNPGTPGFPSRAESRARLVELDQQNDRQTATPPDATEVPRQSGRDSPTYDRQHTGGSEGRESDEGEDIARQRQRLLGEELAGVADKKVDREIDETLDKVNPKYDPNKSAYSENCTGVVQANELQRRGVDVQAGPLESHLRTDQGGPGGRSLNVIEDAWKREFTDGTKDEIEEAFQDPGSRGIVYISWHGNAGSHVFNVENVGGKVRFVDGQPTPSVPDSSHYFNLGGHTAYLRLDDLQTPDADTTKPYLEHE